MTTSLAVIGDRFMKPDFFVEALHQRVGAGFDLRTRELAWPDEAMQHGYAVQLLLWLALPIDTE